ncbi:MAG: hypothetical protein OSB63_03245 [Planctomycetota bacterium]|nr:hypothetical protein [Planctomycetota bacterium]
MKLILKVSAAASCSLIAVMQTPVNTAAAPEVLAYSPVYTANSAATQLTRVIEPVRQDIRERSILANTLDEAFVGSDTFNLAGLELKVEVTFHKGTFHQTYTATNALNHAIWWTGSEKLCGVKNYHAKLVDRDLHAVEFPARAVLNENVEQEHLQACLMVPGEQRVIRNSIDAEYFEGADGKDIYSLRWWSIVPLPNLSTEKQRYEFADLYGTFHSDGRFDLKLESPFWVNMPGLDKPDTALAKHVELGRNSEVIEGMRFDSVLRYEAGAVVETITTTNISGGGLYWPQKVKSRFSRYPLSYTIDQSRDQSWMAIGSPLIAFGCGGGIGGCYGRRKSKPDAADFDRWFVAPGQSFTHQSFKKFDSSQFRDLVFDYGRKAIRGISRVRGAVHTTNIPLNYPPEFFPHEEEWPRISFEASFDKDKGYSHLRCE